MAFTSIRAGDRFGQRSTSNVPKSTAVATYANSFSGSPTTPLAGHLVVYDYSANDLVMRCPASTVPYGLVESINSGNGTVSVWKLAKVFSMVLEYVGTPGVGTLVRGARIQANGTIGTIPIGGILRDQVKAVAKAAPETGIGVIVALDEPRVGLMVVEFGEITNIPNVYPA